MSILPIVVGKPGPEHDAALAKAVYSSLTRQAAGVGPPVDEALLGGVEVALWPRLFAEGYHARCAEKDPADRRAFHVAAAPLIRSLEDHTGKPIWTAVARTAPDGEAGWIHEAAAADLARRGKSPLRVPVRFPWLLSALDPLAETRSLSLLPGPDVASRIDALLADPAHRLEVVRRIAAEAGDARLLRSLCASPRFFGADQLCARLLAEGDSAQISCALFALCNNPGPAPDVADALAGALVERPFVEVARRCVEIYAQASLFSAVPADISQAVLDLVALAAEEGELGDGGEVLLAAVEADGRVFRHLFLPAAVADAVEASSPDLAASLRRGVFERFIGTFTPVGVTHPLNDEAFGDRIGAVLASRAQTDPDSVADLLAVGGALGDLAVHLRPEAPGSLETLFHASYARAILAAARRGWSQQPGGRTALLLYGTMGRLASGPACRLLGSGLLGALEHHVEPGRADAIVPSLLLEVGRLEARESAPSVPAVSRHRTDPQLRAVSVPAGPPEPEDFKVPAAAVGTARTPWMALLRLYTGIEILIRVLALPLRALGLHRDGQLEIDGDNVRFRESVRLGAMTLRHQETELGIEEFVSVRAEPSPATIYRLTGWGILVSFASIGMMLFFDGLRTQRLSLALAGGGVGLLGLLVDGACHRAWLEGHGRSVVTFEDEDGDRVLCCRLDDPAANTLLDRLKA